jgi:hypothetical protein
MFEHHTTRTLNSRVCPGVVITVRKITEKRRSRLMIQTAALLEKDRELAKRFEEINKRAKPVFEGVDEKGQMKPKMRPVVDGASPVEQEMEFTPEDARALLDVVRDRQSFEALEVHPVYISTFVSSVEGLLIDGKKATIDDLLGDDSPDGLTQEIVAFLLERIDLSSEEKKTSQSPSISAEA